MEATKLTQNLDELMDAFQVHEIKNCQHLNNILTVSPSPLKVSHQEIFDVLLEEINDKGDQWNEEELKMKFIALLFFIAEIEEKGKVQAFYERPLNITKFGHKLAVKVDCMIATPLGKNTPREPYFFLQEFKKGKGDRFDPEAQMLAAMLIAQERNQSRDTTHEKHPIFGAFIVGRNWIFTALQGQSYCKSPQYDASIKDELLQIIFILRQLKKFIINIL